LRAIDPGLPGRAGVKHLAQIRWQLAGDFAANEYSRAHVWQFDGGAELAASASPDIVPLPLSVAENVDPEEAFVASVASCHMLWFLDHARRAGFAVRRYDDDAVGQMRRNDQGGLWIARIDLNISVQWDGAGPAGSGHQALHHAAHQSCFIANSVRSEININLK